MSGLRLADLPQSRAALCLNMDKLLVKYMLGESTDAETQVVSDWLASNENNRDYFNHFRTIWKQSSLLAPNNTSDSIEAWERFQMKWAITSPGRSR